MTPYLNGFGAGAYSDDSDGTGADGAGRGSLAGSVVYYGSDGTGDC